MPVRVTPGLSDATWHGDLLQRDFYPKPLTQAKARAWTPPKPPPLPKRTSSVLDTDWRPELLRQASEWELEAQEQESLVSEKRAAKSAATKRAWDFLSIEIDLALRLLTLKKKLEHQIKEWDENSSGSISRGEFRLRIRSLGLKHPV